MRISMLITAFWLFFLVPFPGEAGTLAKPVPAEALHWTKSGGGEFVSGALDKASRFLPPDALIVGTECLPSTHKDVECVFLYTLPEGERH